MTGHHRQGAHLSEGPRPAMELRSRCASLVDPSHFLTPHCGQRDVASDAQEARPLILSAVATYGSQAWEAGLDSSTVTTPQVGVRDTEDDKRIRPTGPRCGRQEFHS